jgi:hypothetical protein
MVVSSDSIKNATATSQGSRRLLASDGTCDRGGTTAGGLEEFISDYNDHFSGASDAGFKCRHDAVAVPVEAQEFTNRISPALSAPNAVAFASVGAQGFSPANKSKANRGL